MERFCVVHALRPSWPNILIYIKDGILVAWGMYSLLCFHYFISPWYKPPSVLPIIAPPRKLCTHEALDDSNMRQQCLEVEIWGKPPTKEDAPVGTSLRQSSQKAAREATDSH